jgi:hypothetical protein
LTRYTKRETHGHDIGPLKYSSDDPTRAGEFSGKVQHSTLVAVGVRWLSRQCSVVLYEFATAAGENPDVIGWAAGAGSVLIECKMSRSDFLKDAEKTVRKNQRVGMGQRRFYLCPPDLIQVKDLPAKWGLLWAQKG